MEQNQSVPEQTFEESVQQMLPTLPQTVRAYLTSGKYSLVAKNLMGQYRLHIDQAGILERELMLLIMGLSNPQEFLDHLKDEAHIPDETARQITGDINKEIFIPMRDEMRNEGAQAVREQHHVPPPPPAEPAPRPVAVEPPPPPPAYAAAPSGSALPPRGVMPGASAPRFVKPMQAPAWAPPPRQAPEPPRPVFGVPGPMPAPVPSPAHPLPPPNLPTGEGVAALPHDAPIVPPPSPVPAAGPLPPPEVSSTPDDATPHTRYSQDPYREPIE